MPDDLVELERTPAAGGYDVKYRDRLGREFTGYRPYGLHALTPKGKRHFLVVTDERFEAEFVPRGWRRTD